MNIFGKGTGFLTSSSKWIQYVKVNNFSTQFSFFDVFKIHKLTKLQLKMIYHIYYFSSPCHHHQLFCCYVVKTFKLFNEKESSKRLILMSDWNKISPYNINTISSRYVMKKSRYVYPNFDLFFLIVRVSV